MQLQQPDYKELRNKIPIIGIWDDHDYGRVCLLLHLSILKHITFFTIGRNDGCKIYPYRKESKQLFLDFLEEPKDTPRRTEHEVQTFYLTFG